MQRKKILSVGVDVAKEKVDIAILFEDQSVINNQFKNNTERDMKKLVEWLIVNQVPTNVPIVIESTGSYHWLSCINLSEQGFQVNLINPLITKKYQRGSIRGNKTDTIDASRLAEIGFKERDLPLFFDSQEGLSSKKYQSLYAKIIKVKQQLSASYKEAKESAERIGISLNLDCIKDCLKHIEETLKMLKQIIEANTSELAADVAEIKGISKFQAAVLCNAVEGRAFDHKQQLIAFFGIDVQAKESGKWKGKEKLSKRGNSFYRLILFQLGWSLARNNEEFGAYYQRLRDNGKHYYTCIIATARKFLRFFFAHYLKKNYHLS